MRSYDPKWMSTSEKPGVPVIGGNTLYIYAHGPPLFHAEMVLSKAYFNWRERL